jgi:hypothetical protein
MFNYVIIISILTALSLLSITSDAIKCLIVFSSLLILLHIYSDSETRK